MKKTDDKCEDSQKLMRLKGVLREMSGIPEKRQSIETGASKSEADPFAILRRLLDNSVICEAGMPYRRTDIPTERCGQKVACKTREVKK